MADAVAIEGKDWELPELVFSGGAAKLRELADAQLRTAGKQPTPPARQDGVDPTGSIQVTVDARGRVQDVEILDDWYEHIEPSHFPNAVYQAYSYALRDAITAKAVAHASRTEEPPDEPPVGSGFWLPRTPEEEERWLRITAEELARTREVLEQELRRDLDALDRERTVSAPGGSLTARLRGRTMVAITGDAYRIEVARPGQLRHDVLAMFRAAEKLTTAGTT